MLLTAATYVANKTKKALEAAMNDGYKISGNVVSSVGPTDMQLKNAQREADEAKKEAAAAKAEDLLPR